MGHSFNPFLHQPLIPPLDQHMYIYVATLQIFTLVKLIDLILLGTR